MHQATRPCTRKCTNKNVRGEACKREAHWIVLGEVPTCFVRCGLVLLGCCGLEVGITLCQVGMHQCSVQEMLVRHWPKQQYKELCGDIWVATALTKPVQQWVLQSSRGIHYRFYAVQLQPHSERFTLSCVTSVTPCSPQRKTKMVYAASCHDQGAVRGLLSEGSNQ